jgi:hypothetical protein
MRLRRGGGDGVVTTLLFPFPIFCSFVETNIIVDFFYARILFISCLLNYSLYVSGNGVLEITILDLVGYVFY